MKTNLLLDIYYKVVEATPGTMTDRKYCNYIKEHHPKLYAKYGHRIDRKLAGFTFERANVTAAQKDEYGDWKWSRKLFVFGKPVCRHCGGSKGSCFDRYGSTVVDRFKPWLPYCSESCSKRSDECIAKKTATTMRKYGVSNVSKSPVIAAKIRKALSGREEELREKWEQGVIAKYGSLDAFYKSATKQRIATNRVRYGGNAPTCSKDVLHKRDMNYFKNHGVFNPSQNPEVWEKITNSWKKRKEIVIGGVRFQGLQGYEPQVLEWLIKSRNIKPCWIKTGKQGVQYTDTNGKMRYYYPDFWLEGPDGKTYCIEVKSTYTAGLNKVRSDVHSFETLKCKARGVIDSGYEYRLVLYDTTLGFYVAKGMPSKRKLTLSVAKRQAQLKAQSSLGAVC